MVDVLKLPVLLALFSVFCCCHALHFRKFHSPYNPKIRNDLPSEYNYKTMYLTQKTDHFGFENDQTFQMRYLVANQFWNGNNGPIFFYTGNEGDIAWFCNNTGFMWDIAPEFKALLVFAEHRYYGESLPFGPDSYANASMLNYLSAEQALADFAELIRFIKQTVPGAANSPVVAFGGSYGGMLAAWIRLKYPNLVQGSLAGSAPIWQFQGLTGCNTFYDIVERTFQTGSQQCVNNIGMSWSALDDFWPSSLDVLSKIFSLCKPLESKYDLSDMFVWLTEVYSYLTMVDYPYPASFLEPLPAWPVKLLRNIREGYMFPPSSPIYTASSLDVLSKIFSLCKPLESKYDLPDLMDWLAGVYVNLAMVDYPYPASFLEPLPGWPVKEFCKYLSKPLKDKALITAIAEGVKMYFNYTGQAPCLNISQQATGNLGDRGWDYQACTEMVMPLCSNGSSMFYNIPWDFNDYSAQCKQRWGITPRENWISLNYWGKNIKSATNIIFSNGLLDPWSGGGVLQSLSPSLTAIQIPSGAHHLDLRAANPGDTGDVKAAREQEKNIIRNWLYGKRQ